MDSGDACATNSMLKAKSASARSPTGSVDLANMKMPDEAATQKTYEMLKKSDPAGAEKFLAERARAARRSSRACSGTCIRSRRRRWSGNSRSTGSIARRSRPRLCGRRRCLATRRAKARRNSTPTARANCARSRPRISRRSSRRIRDAKDARASVRPTWNVSAPLITDAIASYDLTNLRAGPAERAISVKPDPAFPDFKDPNRIQLIAFIFSVDPDPKNIERRAWQQRVKDTFDYAALAALLK